MDDYKANPQRATLANLCAVIASKGFLIDTLSEDDGKRMALHRLQSCLFTVLLASYFAIEVIQNCAMPTLSTTQLALLGVSGGAYVGFKLAAK